MAGGASAGAPGAAGAAKYVTPWEVATMMRRAGFPDNQLVQGVAIVGAESGYNVSANNGTHGGLFQIAFNKGYDQGKLITDPQYNVNAAYQVWKSQGWANGWLNHEGGSSTKFTASAITAVQTSKKNVPNAKLASWNVHTDDISTFHEAADVVPGGNSVYTGAQSVASGVGSVASFFTNLDNWERGAEIAGGALLFLAGLIMLGREAI